MHIRILKSILILLLAMPVLVSAGTVGFMSDGDDSTGPHEIRAMIRDIDELDDQLPDGWILDAIQFNGDISYDDNNSEDAVRAWQSSDVRDVPLFLTLGNHEAETPRDVEYHRAYFDTVSEQLGDIDVQLATQIRQAQTTNYSYEVDDIHVAVVNQYVTDRNDSEGRGYIHDDVFEWLREDLKNATATHKIVAGHEPMYPIERHVGDSLDNDPNNRDKFANLLASYGVLVHTVGHTHYAQLEETKFEWDVFRQSVLGGGTWELDTGAFGTKALNTFADGYPALGYFHSNSSEWGDYEIRLVKAENGWSNPTVETKTHQDLTRQILVNTWEGSGTGATKNGLIDMRYWVDYTDAVEDNPDWFEFNSGKWWEPEFDEDSAGWKEGELSVGYDDNVGQWGWINTVIDPDPTETGEEQVWGIFGRATFQADHPETYDNLFLDLDWEDSVHIWLNGVLIFSNENTIPVPTTGEGDEYFDKATKFLDRTNVLGKELSKPRYQRLNITNHLDLVRDGKNVLAYMSNNGSDDLSRAHSSSDSALAIRLIMEGQRLVIDDDNDVFVEDVSFWGRVKEYFAEQVRSPLVIILTFAIIIAVFVVIKHFFVKYL